MAIAASSDYIKNVKEKVIRPATTPPEFRAQRLPVPKSNDAPSIDVAQISNQNIKPQELKLHPQIPNIDIANSSIIQTGNTLLLLSVLLPREYQKYAAEAIKEQQLLKGTA